MVMQKVIALKESIEKMRLDTLNLKNKEIITPMGKSYCNARIQAFNDVLEIIKEVYGYDTNGKSKSEEDESRN